MDKPSFCILNGKNTCQKKKLPRYTSDSISPVKSPVPYYIYSSYFIDNSMIVDNLDYYASADGKNYLVVKRDVNLNVGAPYIINDVQYLVVGSGGSGSVYGGGGGGGEVKSGNFTTWSYENVLSIVLTNEIENSLLYDTLYVECNIGLTEDYGNNGGQSGNGNSGGEGSSNLAGGGGGGNGGNGSPASGSTGGMGGLGVQWPYDPIPNNFYGSGGGGASSSTTSTGSASSGGGQGGTPTTNPTSGTLGGGGGGSSSLTQTPGNGGDGVVALYWETKDLNQSFPLSKWLLRYGNNGTTSINNNSAILSYANSYTLTITKGGFVAFNNNYSILIFANNQSVSFNFKKNQYYQYDELKTSLKLTTDAVITVVWSE